MAGKACAAKAGTQWPRITVVTPSFNQGAFLEETLKSVLTQGYPNLEYFVIDGGSSDGSVDIIQRYARQLSGWLSESDRGQAHAINKGLAKATGEIFGFVNSDDRLAPQALYRVAEAMQEADIAAGWVENFGMGSSEIIANRGLSYAGFLLFDPAVSAHTPAIWLRTADVRRLDGFREDLVFLFDYDLLLRRLRERPRIRYVDQVLTYFRLHPDSKTVSRHNGFLRERAIVHAAHLAEQSRLSGLRLRARLAMVREKAYRTQLRFDRRALAHGWPGGRLAACILWRWLQQGRRRMLIAKAGELRRLLKAHRAAPAGRTLPG